MQVTIDIPEKALQRYVAKNILTLDDVIHSLGGPQRVEKLRKIGALVGKRDGAAVVFRPADVARVSAEFFEGLYDEQLAAR